MSNQVYKDMISVMSARSRRIKMMFNQKKMLQMKNKWLMVLCLSLISIGLFSCSTTRVNQIMKSQIAPILEDRARTGDILEDPQMHVVLVGSGGPMNNEDRLSALRITS